MQKINLRSTADAVINLENQHLGFAMFADASAQIIDKQHNAVWQIGSVMQQDVGIIAEDVVWIRNGRFWADYFIGRFRVSKLGAQPGQVRVEILNPPWTSAKGVLTARFELQGAELVMHVEEIDPKLPSVNFPPPIDSRSLVIPTNVGKWLRRDQPEMTSYFLAPNCGLNMRWIGGLAEDNDAGWMMICEENYTDIGVYRNNLSVSPCFIKSKGKYLLTRSVRYCFTRGGYNAMAKRFRRYAYDNGFARSLSEKITRSPALDKLRGGRIVAMFQASTFHVQALQDRLRPITPEDRARDGKIDVKITHRDANQIINLARQWGMDKGLFMMRGSFAGGYDERHPDIWPPEKALGSIEELAGLVSTAAPCLAALHDNYQDIYPRSPSFPANVIQRADGSLMQGGYWHGGQCFITCSKQQRQIAERNWQQLRTLNMPAHFIDTAACVQFYECYHPDHPQARNQDPAAKLALMKFYKEQGVVLGSEEASDFGLGELDWLENRHAHTPGESIPLWPLVFHDSAFLARYPSNGTSGGEPASMAANYLWGYMAYWPANNLADWRTRQAAFQSSMALDKFHARVGCDELISHQYLEDGLVEKTIFSSGLAVIANFAKEKRTVEGRELVPDGWAVIE